VPPTRGQIEQAKDLFREFTGENPEHLNKVKIRTPKTGLVIGELDGVLYTTVRDGETEKYVHEFKRKSRPLLVASSDGQSLHIIGEGYEFTERGIVDT
jgi:hypothetical protein